jgi:molybdate transport system substrate-binding protein
MTSLNILGGGAAQGLVASLGGKFRDRFGFDIAGEFGAVGAMAGKLRGGTKADLVILTSALIADLARENLVARASIRDVGRVETALAVRAADPPLSVDDAASLRDALLGADAIFVPDTKSSTAGIHVAKVLQQLGIADAVAARLKIHPNGATAMRHLAESNAARPIGCTQSTEIINTEGVKLSGPLPRGCDLSTLYTLAIATAASYPRQAQALADLLTNAEQQEMRARAGFLDTRNRLQS